MTLPTTPGKGVWGVPCPGKIRHRDASKYSFGVTSEMGASMSIVLVVKLGPSTYAYCMSKWSVKNRNIGVSMLAFNSASIL